MDWSMDLRLNDSRKVKSLILALLHLILVAWLTRFKSGRPILNLGEEDVFETPKRKDSGEADISPSGLLAAETLVHVASQKTKTYTRKVKSGLKNKFDVGVSSGDRKSDFKKFKSASKEIESGFTNISSGEVRVSQRKGKEVLEEQPQPKRSKKQIRE
ncbi:hypothetical protein Tco_1567569 [Tanacetum coccineum]